jgi:hypothetical protein
MKKRQEKRETRPQLKALWNALDEAAFGPERTLNLREQLPSAAEARARTETWLKARQVTRAESVLIITGRGNQSVGGVSVVREEILRMLPSLRRRGIVESWREHNPGALVVDLAPLSALLGAGKRRRDTEAPSKPAHSSALNGLSRETYDSLRQLALIRLDALSIDATDQFIEDEMTRVFSTLLRSLPADGDREAALQAALQHAIDESE